MSTLILGGGGMLARALVEANPGAPEDLLCLAREELDITDREALLRAVGEARPDVIINCAAFTAVDECERRQDEAMRINGEAAGFVARAAESVSALLVQVSTDYVFDGRGSVPYDEGATPAPLSVYGRSKLEGERLALGWTRSLVVRTSWLFGPGGNNFVAAIARRIEEGHKPLRVVSDQVGCPTYTPYLARAIWELCGLRQTGIVNYRNRGPVSWHGLAKTIASLLGDPDEVEAISAEELASAAPRPAFSVLDVSRFESLVGREVETWQSGLEEYLHLKRDRGTS